MIAYVGTETLTRAIVAEVLGVADRRVLVELAGAVLDRDAGAALRILARCADVGVDLGQLARAFLGFLRDLEVVGRVTDAADLVDATPDELDEARALARKATAAAGGPGLLGVLFDRWARAIDESAKSQSPRLILEMALSISARPSRWSRSAICSSVSRVWRGGCRAAPRRSPALAHAVRLRPRRRLVVVAVRAAAARAASPRSGPRWRPVSVAVARRAFRPRPRGSAPALAPAASRAGPAPASPPPRPGTASAPASRRSGRGSRRCSRTPRSASSPPGA